MAKYVKFLRGTPAAYEKLAQKDSDTLYFIYEQDESTGVLYLGSKLIAGSTEGGGSTPSASGLADLKDVILTELNTDSFLVYDTSAAAWVNKTFEQLLFVGSTAESAGLGGLVPAPEKNQLDLFLRSDGSWAKPSTVDHTILTLENVNKTDHLDLIVEKTDGLNSISGDIVIIKDLISGDKWQYTAYVFDDNDWHAMDGNYSADNVYFGEDLITTTEIGNISLVDGRATIAAAGKNLKEVFETIFVNEEDPEITNPSVTLSFNNGEDCEVGSVISPSYVVTFDSGKYSFGPATNVTIINWEVSDDKGNTLNADRGTFNEITVIDDFSYTITAVANHSEGSVPVTNLGKEVADSRILAGNVSASKTGIAGFRNSFYGTLDNKDELTSDIIRTLKPSNKALKNGSVITVPITLGAYRVVFAYPADLNDITSVTDVNGLGAEILSGFTKITVDVKGANDYEAKSYKVYYIDYANANDKTNSYIFKIGEEG